MSEHDHDDEWYEERGELPLRIREAIDSGDVPTVREYMGFDEAEEAVE